MQDVSGFDRKKFEQQAATTMLHIWWMTQPPEDEFDSYYDGLPAPTIARLTVGLQAQYTVELANRRHAAHEADIAKEDGKDTKDP